MITTRSESLYVRRDRIAGGLIGLLVGDALGVPYEFHPPHRLPPLSSIDFTPPENFSRSHAGVPPGTWSDDGAQALCLLASLLHRGRLDLGDFSRRLVNWVDFGYLAVDGNVFDIGMQTARALAAIRDGAPPAQSGPARERDNGNGSLMRVLPLALWHRGDDAELVTLAALQSVPTHGHARAQVACAMACLWARATLADHPATWAWAADALRGLADRAGFPREEVERVLDPDNAAKIGGSGYVVDTLWSARHALDVGQDYESTVRAAIALGHDTDTTAAVAGGIAGMRYGLFGIPSRWREALRGREDYAPLLDGLLKTSAPVERHHGSTVRTSLTHPLRIAELPLSSGGIIGVTFCPGKQQGNAMTGVWQRDLALDLAAIRDWGATHLVTLIEEHEFEELGVSALPQRAREFGLTWHHAPIRDGSIPDTRFDTVWSALGPQLHATLDQGGRVVVHCKGGLGRAGTVAALLLLEHGSNLEMENVLARVRAVRPNAIETVVQEWYLRTLRPV